MAESGGIKAGRAYVEIGANDTLTRALRMSEAKLKAFGRSITAIGVKALAMGAALTAAFGAATALFIKQGDALDKMAKRTGVSVEALSELSFAAGQSGASIESLDTALLRMSRTISDAADKGGEAADSLKNIGLSAQELLNLSPEDRFLTIAERLSQIPDAGQRAAAAMRIFGRGAGELLPLLSEGAEGIKKLRDQARNMGLTISTEDARNAAALNDSLDALVAVVKRGAFAIGAALAPAITGMTKRLTEAVVVMSEWIKRNRGAVIAAATLAAGLAAAGVALIAVGGAISLLGATVGKLVVVLGLAGKALAFVKGVMISVALTAAAAAKATIGLGIAMRVVAAGAAVLVAVKTALAALLAPILIVTKAITVMVAAFSAIAAGSVLGGLASMLTGALIPAGLLAAAGLALAGIMSQLSNRVGGISGAFNSLKTTGSSAMKTIAERGRAALDWLRSRFEALRSGALESFGAIASALASGDIVLAGRVLWTSLKLLWAAGVNELIGYWIDLRNATLAVFYETMAGVRRVFTATITFLRVGWVETVAAMSNIWLSVPASIREGLADGIRAVRDFINSAVGWFTTGTGILGDTWSGYLNSLTEGFYAAMAAIRAAWKGTFDFVRDGMLQLTALFSDLKLDDLRKQAATDDKTGERNAERQRLAAERQRQSDRATLETARQQAFTEIKVSLKAQLEALEVNRDADINAARESLEAAEKAWRQAIDAANKARGEAAATPAIDVSQIASALGEINKTLAPIGAFNPFALNQIFGAAVKPAERTAKATERTAADSKEIKREALRANTYNRRLETESRLIRDAAKGTESQLRTLNTKVDNLRMEFA